MADCPIAMNQEKGSLSSSESDTFAGWSYIATALLAAFFLNWLWEMAQMPAYRGMAAMPWMRAMATCTVATVGDVVMTLLAYAIGAGLSRNRRWTSVGSPKVYAVLATLGFAMAVFAERIAFAFGKWSYQKLQEYERTVVARKVAGGIAGLAVVTGVYYSAPQFDELTQAVANASSSFRSGASVTTGTIDWGALEKQLQATLSEAQWIAYKTLDGPPALTSRLRMQLDDAHTKAVEAGATDKRGTRSTGG